MTDMDQRRRRAAYRAAHRGTKEMDWLLGRYADAHLAGMTEADLDVLERLLALPDPDLQSWIMTGQTKGDNDLTPLVARIRAYHGLNSQGEADRS